MKSCLVPDEHGLITHVFVNVDPKCLGFQSKSDLDPQRCIFSRLRRAAALFACLTPCWAIIKGNGQHTIDKNRLSSQNCVVRRPRANRTLSWLVSRGGLYRRMKVTPKMALEASIATGFGRVACGKILCADIEPSSSSKLQTTSHLDQSADLEIYTFCLGE